MFRVTCLGISDFTLNMSTQVLQYINPWHHSQQTLNFQLSDKTLLRAKLSMLMCELGLNNPPCDPVDLSVLPHNEDSNVLDGYVAWGARVNEEVKTLQIAKDLIVYIPERYNRFYTRLDQSFDEYKQSFKSKTRSGIQRKVNKFAKLSGGEIDFRVYSTPAELKDFLQYAITLTEKTYQTRLLDAGLPTDDAYRSELLHLAEQNKVRAFLLFREDRPVSYLVLDAAADTLIYRYLGYDPDESKTSPGTVLHWLALQYLTEEGKFKYLDFTEGEGQQKRTFGTESIYCANIYWLNKSVKNLALVYGQIALNKFSQATGKLLDAWGIKTKLKQLLRRSG